MMRFLILLLLLAGPAIADPIPVRSGEHDGFTRLVVPLPRGSEWSLEADGRQYGLTIKPHSDGFDMGGVFARITRTRLAELESTPGRLDLVLGCDCEITTDTSVDGYLALDIAAATSQPDDGQRIDAPVDLPLSLPPISPLLPEFPNVGTAERAGAFRKDVLEQLSNAASQNLITITAPPQNLQPDPEPEGPPAIPEPPLGATTQVPPPAPSRLEISTALEDALRALETARKPSGSACYNPEQFDLASDMVHEDFNTELSRHRSALLGEFDRVDPDMAIGLAGLYLRFGLTVEALSVIDGFVPEGLPADMLRAMAAVLDEGELAPEHPLLAMLNCDPKVALWSAASGQAGRISAQAAVAIIPVFSASPATLRELLAPMLIRAFDRSGLSAEADIIRAATERGGSGDAASVQIIAFDTDPDNLSNAELFDVATSSSDRAPAALAAYLERRLAAGDVPDDDLQTLTRAYAAQLTGTALATDLDALDIRMSSRRGDFASALAAINQMRNPVGADLIRHYADDVLNRGTDQQKALLAVQITTLDLITGTDASQRRELADQLEVMGLPELARDVLTGLPGTAPRTETPPDGEPSLQPDPALIAFRDAEPVEITPTLGLANDLIAETARLGEAVAAALRLTD